MAAETIDDRGRRAGEALRRSVSHLSPPPIARPRSGRPTRIMLAAAAVVLVVALVAVTVASMGGGDDGAVTTTDEPAESALVSALPEASRRAVVVDLTALKTALGVPDDHAFIPPAGAADQTLLDELGAVLPHVRRPAGSGPTALDVELVLRAAGNECAMGPECLAVLQTSQNHDDLRGRLLDEGWTADGDLLVNPGSPADVSYPVVGIGRDLVFLGQDQTTVRDALAGRSTPPDRLIDALDQVNGAARLALDCGETTAAIASTPGVSHQVASQADATVTAGETVAVAGDDYLVADVAAAGDWTVVTVEPTDGSARSLTRLADADEPSVLPAVLAATFSC